MFFIRKIIPQRRVDQSSSFWHTALAMGSGQNDFSLAPSVFRQSTWDHVQCQVELLATQYGGTYEQIITLLANGHSPFKVSKWTGIDTDVIRRIRDLNPEGLERVKANLAANLAEASQVLSERLIENAHKLRPENIGKALAIAIDKHALLSGGVTARTEHRKAPTPEELQAMFDSLPKATVTVIEDTKENGDVRHD